MLTRSLCPSCSPEVLATPTADLGKILSAMHKASIGGESDLYTGIQIAQVRRCSNLSAPPSHPLPTADDRSSMAFYSSR
jgi:hypothetical protein